MCILGIVGNKGTLRQVAFKQGLGKGPSPLGPLTPERAPHRIFDLLTGVSFFHGPPFLPGPKIKNTGDNLKKRRCFLKNADAH